MTQTIRIVLLYLLSAGVLTFCTPAPARAESAKPELGHYIDCGKLAKDVSLLLRAMNLGLVPKSLTAANADWYARVVVAHAREALAADNPTKYVRALHKSCLLETV